ncbi:MAG: cryptochrome/photolyase family protein [Allosphingosinicella sp.]|uniref:cryptochrome/photolyase family protein n=1 Tax=Allosphingosinicella sp. TaxID=2823234 RepID=UPI003941EE2A
MSAPSIVWFRQDLRLDDQPALARAAGEGPVVPVYVLDDETPGRWRIGAAQRWWLHHSLSRLAETLERRGSGLVLRRGKAATVLATLSAELGGARIHAVRHYEPWWRAAEAELAAACDLVLHPADVLVPPEQVRTGAGGAYKIYTPYWRALQEQLPPPAPTSAPDRIARPERWPGGEELRSWGLLPTRPDWAAGFAADWHPGEAAALERLDLFADEARHYAALRDRPGEEGTSRFSPHLHLGELSPRRVWHGLSGEGGEKFRKELAWRDFSRNVMLSQPAVGERAGAARFEAFPWRTGADADADFRAWCRGRTGYPIVDAGMRQLWATGWMHNRVRMIAASFLVKHLLIDWRRGAEWFWDTLVDADYGNNSQNWQWIAGTGIDSQPFARIMAPTLQSRKFGAADYIRRWVPELEALTDETIHDPGPDRPAAYPPPIIPHAAARDRALTAFAGFRAQPSCAG